jgi:hypothetical protein
MDRDAVDAELHPWRELGEGRVRPFAPGQAVGDDADRVPAFRLADGDIDDVAEDAADRRAHRVKDAQRPLARHRRRHVRTSVR